MVCSYHPIPSVRFLVLVLGILWAILASPVGICAQTYPFTLDFEDGTLRGWTATGNAFDRQPVRGETRIAQERGQPSRRQGAYWISTYQEQPQTGALRALALRGDGPQGTLTSASFAIPEGRLTFLVGGGSSSQTRVELLAGPSSDIEFMEVVHAASGKNSETMERVSWDLSSQAGKIGRIRIVDASSGSWGHINADDFRFEPPREVSPRPPMDVPIVPVRVAVPGVVGDTVAVALEKLTEARLTAGQVTRETTAGRRPGTVFRQEPVAGRMALPGTAVDLWVAAQETTIVPDLFGQNLELAQGALERARLRPGRVTNRASGRREGTVLEQRPQAGVEVQIDTLVHLVVASPEMVVVPGVVGQVLAEAEALLARAPLGVGRVEERPSDSRPGTVIGQNPDPGAQVGIGSRVDLVVAVPPRARIIEVPDVTGLSLAKARKVLEERQLIPGEVDERESDREAGTVLKQSPGAGSEALPGDAVSLVVAAGGEAFPWGKVGGGLAAAGVAGVVLLRLMRRSRGKFGCKGDLEVIPRADNGFQEIHFPREKEAPNWEIMLRPVPDPGEQVLEVNGPLIAEKEGGND